MLHYWCAGVQTRVAPSSPLVFPGCHFIPFSRSPLLSPLSHLLCSSPLPPCFLLYSLFSHLSPFFPHVFPSFFPHCVPLSPLSHFFPILSHLFPPCSSPFVPFRPLMARAHVEGTFVALVLYCAHRLFGLVVCCRVGVLGEKENRGGERNVYGSYGWVKKEKKLAAP